MPELPEVETTRKGISGHLCNQTVTNVIVRQSQLRWPIPRNIRSLLKGNTIHSVNRRGKYLLLTTDTGTLLIHLGMSGSLRITDPVTALEKHDHFELQLGNNKCLRLRDPRRFGSVLWTKDDPAKHKLLVNLGPEPLSDSFTADYLFSKTRKRKQAIKQFIMDSHVVVGVGNIYASESLFLAGIRPGLAAGRLTRVKTALLVDAIRQVLQAAIKQGGTTLRDFTASDGQPGYFKQELNVYGRAGEPCLHCGTPIKLIRQGQRAGYYCPDCQS